MSQSPLAGLRTIGRGPLFLLGVLGALKGLSLVLIADGIAAGIVSVIGADSGWRSALLLGLSGALLRAAVTWATHVVAQRAVVGEKQRIRSQLAERLVADFRSGNVGAMTTLATRGLDELDKYYTVFLPALVNAATVPLLVGARILLADWPSALVIILTVLLIPVFMTLIGMHTQERVAAASDVMARLSDHIVELARGLPVLIGLGRASEQTEALRQISEDHRRTSVRTLRTAFLSSLALELIATISVAVVAVLIGVRLVAGTMPLQIGLVALILAGECFTPFREIGSAFHASQNGVEALRRVRSVLDAGRSPVHIRRRQDSRVRIDGMSITYPGRLASAVDRLSLDTQPHGITLLHGGSGAGKSTVLAALADILPTDALISGGIVAPDASRIAYLPQHPHTVGANAIDELRIYGGEVVPPDETAEEDRAMLRRLGLAEVAYTDPELLSPGELRRLAFTRVLVRVRSGAELVLLDEPTAHLDARSAAIVRNEIARLATAATLIVASHDPAIHAMADRRVQLDGSPCALPQTHEHEHEHPAEVSTPQAAAAHGPTRTAEATSPHHPYRELTAFLRPVLPRLLLAVLLGTLAVGFAIALSAVSGWLIVRASEHPPILYLLVAIVGVRFFGIGRSVLRWCERLISHDAVFAALTGLRVRLWRGLAAHGPANRSLLGASRALDRLVSDADQVRDLVPRVIMPPLIGLATTAAACIALGVIYPPALWPMAVLAVIGLLIAPMVAVAADRTSSESATRARSRSVRSFAAMLSASAELKANGVDAAVRRRVDTLDAKLARADKRSAWSLGVGTALVVLACSCSAIAMLAVAAGAVGSGQLPAALLAVLVLTPLGLIDPLRDCVDAAQQWPTLKRVLARVGQVTDARAEAVPLGLQGATADIRAVHSLTTENLTYRYPQTTEPVFRDLNTRVERGEWVVVTGQSGSGKSTLLAVLLRYLTPTDGRYRLNDMDAARLSPDAVRTRVAWCPQEGHLFNSSLRANLLIARPREDAPSDSELIAKLERVGLGEFLAELPDGLDTSIGSAGGSISGGQRQRVAVARSLLARSDVLLIDEPTAHLDGAAASALMDDLRSSLHDKITVLVTHQPTGIRSEDRRLVLGTQATQGSTADTGLVASA